MTSDDDVPSGIDLRDPAVAAAWTAEADIKRPHRAELRRRIAERLRALPPPLRVLELGPGPGLLAEEILATCEVAHYTALDFSPPFLAQCRARLGDRAELVLGDFTRPRWWEPLAAPFDAVVAMQAVHELRHKRHAPRLYAELHALLRPGGMLVVCDHVPWDDTAKVNALFSTDAEQHMALAGAGFAHVRRFVRMDWMIGYVATR